MTTAWTVSDYADNGADTAHAMVLGIKALAQTMEADYVFVAAAADSGSRGPLDLPANQHPIF